MYITGALERNWRLILLENREKEAAMSTINDFQNDFLGLSRDLSVDASLISGFIIKSLSCSMFNLVWMTEYEKGWSKVFYTWRSFFLSWWMEYFVFGNNDELEKEQSAIKLRNDHRLFQSWNATKVVLFKGFSSNKYKQFTLKARVN